MTNTIHQLLNILEEGGVEFVIGLPGGGTMAIYAATEDHPSLRTVLVRHEQTAAMMADAYARCSGKPAAVIGQGPFIGASGCLGLMEALTSSSPILVIGDTSDHGMGPYPVAQMSTGEYGHPDLVGLLRSTTKYTSLATTPSETLIGAQVALKHAITGNPGPAALVVRSLALAATDENMSGLAPHDGTDYLVRNDTRAPEERIREAVEMMEAAERPVMIAGKGVHNARAHEEVKQVAHRWGLLVATSYKGISAIEGDDPYAVGVMGAYGHPSANSAVEEADLLVVVGAKLTTADTMGHRLLDRKKQRVIQVDIEPLNAGWTIGPDVALIGDVKTMLRQLLDFENDRSPYVPAHEDRRQRANDLNELNPMNWDEACTQESSPVMPQRLVQALNENLAGDTQITLDAGFNRVWMSYFYRPKTVHSVFAPGGMGAMGWALPAALGVKLARPELPVVAVAGDGGFMMSVHSLATAIEHELPFTAIVMNDSSLGMVRHHQETAVASEFGATDYAAIARSFGADGINVTDSQALPEAIREAQGSGRTTVIDVTIDREDSPDRFRLGERLATET